MHGETTTVSTTSAGFGIIATPVFMRVAGLLAGAGEMNRTPDLLITNELLYQLSYTGEGWDYSLA